MSDRPPSPIMSDLVYGVALRIDDAWRTERACEVRVSPEEWQATAEWSIEWHRWYRHGRSVKTTLRIRDDQLEQWWPDGGWRPIRCGMSGCFLVRPPPPQQGLFG